jgi:hypothetical protein
VEGNRAVVYASLDPVDSGDPIRNYDMISGLSPYGRRWL